MHLKKQQILLLSILTLAIGTGAFLAPKLFTLLKQNLDRPPLRLSGPNIETPWGTVVLAPIKGKNIQCVTPPSYLKQIAYSADKSTTRTATLATYYTTGDRISDLTKYYKNKFHECGYSFIQSSNQPPSKDLTSIKYLYFKKLSEKTNVNAEVTLATATKDGTVYSLVLIRINTFAPTSEKKEIIDFNKTNEILPSLALSRQYHDLILTVLREVFTDAKLFEEKGIEHNVQLKYAIKNKATRADLAKLRSAIEKRNIRIKSAKITPCKLISIQATDGNNQLVINPTLDGQVVYVYIYKAD